MYFEFSAHLQSNYRSSPKKQCLTRQLLTKVARKEGLGWEADLVAHISKILFTLKSPYILLFVQLPILIQILEKVAQS